MFRDDDERPTEQEEREQIEALRESRVRTPLVIAYRDAFHTAVRVDLDETTLRTIGNSYASCCVSFGPEEHPRTLVTLRRAMDAYVAVHPEADALLFPAGCPF